MLATPGGSRADRADRLWPRNEHDISDVIGQGNH